MNNFKFYAFTRFKLGIGATACHAELAKVYPDEAPGKSTIYRWYSDFPDIGRHLNPKNIGGFESSESGEEDDDERKLRLSLLADQEQQGLLKRSQQFKNILKSTVK